MARKEMEEEEGGGWRCAEDCLGAPERLGRAIVTVLRNEVVSQE